MTEYSEGDAWWIGNLVGCEGKNPGIPVVGVALYLNAYARGQGAYKHLRVIMLQVSSEFRNLL